MIADSKLICEQERKGMLMMWGYDFGWGGWILMTFGMVLWVALLVVMGWAIIRWLDSKITRPNTPSTGTPVLGPSAHEILQQRYARGEIETATYQQMRVRFTASGWRDEKPVST